MAYYKFILTGGDQFQRYEYASNFGMRPADHTGHAVVYYLEHPATLDQLRRNHHSSNFEIEITKVTKAEFRTAV